jgi:fatty acid desaturase
MWTTWDSWELGTAAWAGFYVWHLFMAVTVSVIAHNTMHVSMFKSEPMNRVMELWLSFFYGTPVFAWIPTHNRNHHKHNNKEPDYTKTYRYSESNKLWVLLTYPAVSNYYQGIAIREYLQERYRKNRGDFWLCIVQIAAIAAWIGTFLYLNWVAALILVVIPQQFSLYSVVVFNYIQHVHADEESEFNHSRNIVGTGFGSLNFCLFNNGFHTVHHMNANLHWSLTPEAHAKVADKIDPSLNEKYFWGYVFKQYILGPLFARKKLTSSMRLERKAKEHGMQQAAQHKGTAVAN